MRQGWLGALRDLVLPVPCPGCGAGGGGCARCLATVAAPARLALPDPPPEGLPPTFAVAAYDGAARSLLVAHKERGRLDLSRPLGAALSAAVAAGRPPRGARVVLVPVPTTAAARRARGYDHTVRLAVRAAAGLRARGLAASVAPVLRHRRAVLDSVGLSSAARAANLAGAFAVGPGAVGLRGAWVAVVDDVVTTGATFAEAARVLRAAGIDVAAAAAVAATVRRGSPARWPGHPAHPRAVQ